MNSKQAKTISLQTILEKVWNLEPMKIDKGGNEIWYNSPFRYETAPSFKINVSGNVWFDFGEGEGGNIIDLVMKRENCDIKTALDFLKPHYNPHQSALFQAPLPSSLFSKKNDTNESKEIDTNPFKLLDVKELNSKALKNYLSKRHINVHTAAKHIKEVHYAHKDKNYFAIGFKNDLGGYELRNPYFKGSIGQKGVKLIRNKSNPQLSLFEGFMDFLSCLTHQNIEQMKGDVLILNSLSFQKEAFNHIESSNYKKVFTFFDNDTAGEKMTNKFKETLTIPVQPLNHLYQGYKDYNEFLCGNQKSI